MAEANNNTSSLELSDEDFLNAPPPAFEPEAEEEESDEQSEAKDDAEEEAEEQEEESGEEESEEVDDPSQDGTEEDDSEEEDDSSEESESEDESDEDGEEPDYKAQLAELYKPFRANGKDMQVDNIEDARRLMQMGANYNKKMASLKPNLKLMKMLQNNELLDESKLALLIDASKGKPEALAKLAHDHKIDPLKLPNQDENTDYKPDTYTVSDREMDLEQVLTEIEDSPKFADTIAVLSNKWDEASRQALVDKPEMIRALNAQMELGIYDRVASEVERKRALGHLQGLDDFAAYRKVGDEIDARGGFADLMPKAPAAVPGAQSNAAQDEPSPKSTAKQTAAALKNKKRAASPTRPAAKKKASVKDFDPLAMSDEEFEKLDGRFM